VRTSNDVEARVFQVAEQAELTKDQGDDALVGKGVRRSAVKAQMMSFRIATDESKEITRIAGQLGVPVSALVRGWVTEGLARHHGASLPGTVERLAAEVEILRALLR
jgi:hypothetical protein